MSAAPSRIRAWQDVAGRFSVVKPQSSTVDPMRRYRRAALRIDADEPAIRALVASFEMAYGYSPPKEGRAYTRRAPSAGALYPTEVLCIGTFGGQFECCYYSFVEHALYRLDTADTVRCRQLLAPRPGSFIVACASVLWRSVQRYGVRGYRYCLIDAGAVLANIAGQWHARGGSVDGAMPRMAAALETALGLRRGEAVLGALALNYDGAAPAAPSLAPPGLPVPQYPAEAPPQLSPMLERVIRLHRGTCDSDAQPAGRWDWGAGAAEGAAVHAPDRRHSARRFADVPLDGTACAQLQAAIDGQCGRDRAFQVHLLVLPPGPARLAFRAVCMDQDVVAKAGIAAIVTMSEQVRDAEGAAYRRAVLDIGAAVASLYAVAAGLGLGTTCVGGFDDAGLMALCPRGGQVPVIVQVFGHDAGRAGQKEDAQSRPEEPPAGSAAEQASA